MKYREAQSDFFGKRGITWHITVVSRTERQQQDEMQSDDNGNASSPLSEAMDQDSSFSDDVGSGTTNESSEGKQVKASHMSSPYC